MRDGYDPNTNRWRQVHYPGNWNTAGYCLSFIQWLENSSEESYKLVVIMMLHAFYSCPAGNQIALEVDALSEAPETIRQPEKTLFSACWCCESAEYEAVIRESRIKTAGYCELRLGKIGQ